MGTVKNLVRFGVFIFFFEGEEGFFFILEEVDEGFGNIMGNSFFEVG